MKRLFALIALFGSSVFSLAQVQLGKNVQVGAANASGGSLNPGLQTQIVQYPANGTTGGPTGLTTDAATGNNLTVPGALNGNVTNGTFNTDSYISGGGNNGLGNLEAGACSTGGCSALFPATSTSTESPIPTVSNTGVEDRRGGGLGRYFYNPSATGAAGYNPFGNHPSAAKAFIVNFDKEQLVGGSQAQVGMNEWLNFNAPGWSWGTNTGETGFDLWSGTRAHIFSMTTFTPGISQYQSGNCYKYSVGDSACPGYFYNHPDAGATSPSDEGADDLGLHLDQNSTWFHGTVATGATAGTQTLPTTYVSGSTSRLNFAVGGYMLDTSRALLVNASVTGPATQMPSSGPWAFPVSATVTESTAWGKANAAIPTPADPTQPSTDTVSFTVTGGTNAGGYTTGKAWLDGAQHPEQVMITAVGTISGGIQSVTFTHRYPDSQTGTYLFQGGTNGFYYSIIMSFGTTYGAWSTGYPVFGATDSGHLVGRFAAATNQPIPSFYSTSTTNVPLTNLSVSGSTVTATVNANLANNFDNLQSAVISAASNSAFNGTATNLHLINDAQLQWTQTVTGTSATANISYPANYYQFNLFPGAEVVQPAAIATPNVAQLGPNDVAWTPGDTLQNVQQASFSGALITGHMYVSSPDSQLQSGIGGIGYQVSGPGVSGQYHYLSVNNTNSSTLYRGGGGLLGGPNGIYFQGPMSTTINTQTPIDGSPVININCSLVDGCNTTNTTKVLSINGAGAMNYLPAANQFYFNNLTAPKLQANVLSTGDGRYVNGGPTGGAPVALTAASSANQNRYTSLGTYGVFGNEGLLDASADIGAHAFYAGTLYAGAQPPTVPGPPYVNGVPGTSTFTYEAVSNTQNGQSLPSAPTSTSTGNAVLTSSNSISVFFTPGKGAQSTDVYRTAAPAGYTLGRICTAVSNFNVGGNSSCIDIGQATTGSLPTTDTSGNITSASATIGNLSVTSCTGCGSGSSLPSGTTNQMLYYAGAGTTVTPLTLGTNLSITSGVLNASSTAATNFNALTSGTNTTAAMLVGTGASLGVTGSGTIAASTAAALAATPTLCTTGNAPTGVLANGNATGCAPISGGTGTVTAVSVATANGVSGTSSGGSTPALTISLGAITPSSVTTPGSVSANNFISTDTTHNSSYTGQQAAGGVDVLPTQASGSSYITYLAATGFNEADGTGAFSPLTRAVDFAAGPGLSVSVSGKTVTYSPTASVKSFGAIGDGAHPTQDNAGLRAGINSVCTSGGSLYIPAGTYNFDNSAGAFAVSGCAGRIYGDGPSSVIVFSTLANDGWDINTPTSFGLENLHLTFAGTTTTRQPSVGYPVNINGGSNIVLRNLLLNNGNISAMRVGNAQHVRIEGTTLSGFLANGVYTVNNNDIQIRDTSCTGGGDACVEVDWIDSAVQNAQPAIVDGVNSYNDVSCVLIDGTSQVTVSNFNCVKNAHQGIYIEQDSTTGNNTHYPDQIVIGNGNIVDAGYGTNSANLATATGLTVYIQNTPASKQRITLHNVNMTHIGGNAVTIADNNTVDLKMDNVLVDAAGGGGATGTNGRNQACFNLDGDRVEMNTVTAANCAGPSLYSNLTNTILGTGFTSINPNSTANTTQAVYYASGNNYNTLLMNGLTLIDTQGTNLSGITNAAANGAQFIPAFTTSFTAAWPGVTNSNGVASIYPASTHLAGRGAAPTSSVNAPVAGTGATSTVAAGGHDSAFTLNITTGTGPTSGVLTQVNFSVPFVSTRHCGAISGNNAASTAQLANLTFNGGSVGQMNVNAITAPAASTAYSFEVVCVQ
ncbi:right-handed parallel beta-helix repeat-containing protein [Edaphobacter paludis]|uniref:Right-handed parallel beta-helix repeat-containing protein n=1 Tax=Edaphobacter paludis TaxID=3035702 RepID=A0AAU7D808_9BACT